MFCEFLPISAAVLVTCLPANQPPAGFLPKSLHGSIHSHSRPLTSKSDSSAQAALISASMFCLLLIAHTVSAGWHTELVSAIAKGCPQVTPQTLQRHRSLSVLSCTCNMWHTTTSTTCSFASHPSLSVSCTAFTSSTFHYIIMTPSTFFCNFI